MEVLKLLFWYLPWTETAVTGSILDLPAKASHAFNIDGMTLLLGGRPRITLWFGFDI